MDNFIKIRRFISLVLIAILALGMLLAMRPLPSIVAISAALPKSKVEPVNIPWPSYGQASIGEQRLGLLESHGQQKPVPMASITKLVTALTVLEKKPLGAGEAGPTIALSEADVALYPSYLSRQGSVVPVAAGQKISQYQAMQAMMIPSANNMADSLAMWAFGSLENYVKEANSFLRSKGLANISVADASGFSAQSVGTSDDLVKLGILAMKNPVIADIVAKKSADLPLAGIVFNTNRLLDVSGIVGIKTGNTDEAGGCYLYAANHVVNGQNLMIIGAVLGSPSLSQALADSQRILATTKLGFVQITPVVKSQVVAIYDADWGEKAQAIAKKDIHVIGWHGHNPKISTKFKRLDGVAAAGTKVGVVEVDTGIQAAGSEVVLNKEIPPPSPSWRIFH